MVEVERSFKKTRSVYWVVRSKSIWDFALHSTVEHRWTRRFFCV